MRSVDFLRAFDEARGTSPVVASSGVSGALWRYGHRPPTIYNSGMSYATPSALGLALARPDLRSIALEGDGSMIMGLANLTTVGRYQPENLVIVVYNNRTYHPTGTTGELRSAAAYGVDLTSVASASGLAHAARAATADELVGLLERANRTAGPHFIEVEVDNDRDTWDLGRAGKQLDRVAGALEFEAALAASEPARPAEYGNGRTGTLGPGPRTEDPALVLHDAIRSAGVDLAVYLPEGTLYPLQILLERDDDIPAVCCAREDEGVAIGGGAAWAGGTPALVIEGTGVGLAPLALAGLITRRTPLLLVSSHSESLGVRRPWDDIAALTNEPVLRALGIPTVVLTDVDRAHLVVRESVRSMRMLRRPVAVVVPPYVMDGPG